MLGQFVVGDLLGSGGMGRVYAARDPRDRAVAIKVLHEALANDPTMRERLAAEADAARRINHRNVVRVHEHVIGAGGAPFLVMEQAPGVSLGALIQAEGSLPLARIRAIAAQVLAGVAAIHRAGMVHGDMKSDNVLVDIERDDHVTIIDFGLARAFAHDSAGEQVPPIPAQMLAGTPAYMAPEVIRGEALTPAADLYAVGMIIYEMLTGATPFGGDTATAVFERQLSDEVVPPSLRCPDPMPASFEHVLLHALAKDPTARPRDAECFATAIRDTLPATSVAPVRAPRTITGSTEAKTTWMRGRNVSPRRLAAGTKPGDSAAVTQRRDEVETARATRNADACIVAYLSLVEALTAERRLDDAALELEQGIAWIASEVPDADSRWRLVLTLAALHAGLGAQERAHLAALEARRIARAVLSQVGERRANALLRRLAAAANSRARPPARSRAVPARRPQ